MEITANTTTRDDCTGQCRWVPLSPMQAHRRRLQQLWRIWTYQDGAVSGYRDEWRDVPFVTDAD